MATLQLALNDQDLKKFKSAIEANDVNAYIETITKSYISTPTTLKVVQWDFVEGSSNLKINVEIV